MDWLAHLAAGKQHRANDPNARAEGLLLLTSGHILVAKQMSPVYLIEFGPDGDEPVGVGDDSVLPPDRAFSLPAEETARLVEEQLRAADPSLKVLFISGHIDSPTMAQGRREIELPVLAKPFEQLTLARRVREVLDAIG